MKSKLLIATIAVATLLLVSCEKEDLQTLNEETTINDNFLSLKTTTTGWVIYPNWDYSISGGIPAWKCFAKGSKMVVSVTNNNSQPIYVTLNYATNLCGNPDVFNSFWVSANQAKSFIINSWGHQILMMLT